MGFVTHVENSIDVCVKLQMAQLSCFYYLNISIPLNMLSRVILCFNTLTVETGCIKLVKLSILLNDYAELHANNYLSTRVFHNI